MHWASPISSASLTVRERSSRSWVVRFSANTSTAENTMSPMATLMSCSSMLLITSLKARPTKAMGRDPTTRARARAKPMSRSARFGTEANPPKKDVPSRSMSLRKARTAATIAPVWMTAVNPISESFCSCVPMGGPSSRSTMSRCAVLDTGRNSVSPSTTPGTMAWPMFTQSPSSGARQPKRPRRGGKGPSLTRICRTPCPATPKSRTPSRPPGRSVKAGGADRHA